MITELHVRRDDLGVIAAIDRSAVIEDGEALFRIERFALTANNMTYAAHGVDMGYWGFFPAPAGFGIVPVWGFAVVAESRAEGVAVGERFYGYWPMASHAVLLPGKVSARGFSDVGAHRLALPPVYNNYVPASDAYGPETVQALFRPLYTTSFVLDVMLADSLAQTLVLTSASSKTALGLAQAAKGRQRVIGLTSAANRAFVEATGYYDNVVEYSDVADLAGDGPVALVDFSGNGAVRHAVHVALGERLIESHVVGDTHWDMANSNDLPGVAAKMFFAPTVIVERVKEWGPAGFEARLAAAWGRFIASTGWVEIIEADGAEAVAGHWRGLAAGRIDPAEGLVLTV
ncbi:hypothetical protein GCM10011529_07040 [Polymorphobacter glacialis]|uniref:DUF2855 family protein n=2 Tax=Sandarakinorhabdus glacialis TaxID=1614636 RepID=A0A917E4V8_9SPHN|nr:hypothetical protein GCM10011529_07040 [Polymorphobacter glacialis]